MLRVYQKDDILADLEISWFFSPGWWFQIWFIFTPTWGNDMK